MPNRFATMIAVAAGLAVGAARLSQADAPSTSSPSVSLSQGPLKAVVSDNSRSRRVLSGLTSLVNEQAAPGFNAFDRGVTNGSGGLNFEHIICGHKTPHNAFSPREGPFRLSSQAGTASAMLTRDPQDDPWKMSYTMKYTLVAPCYVDLEFRCTAHDAAVFGPRGYAALFFADYMNDVEKAAIRFRGIEAPGGPEKWIEADAPPGHPDWVRGGSYRSVPAAQLAYDADHNFKLNLWSYDYPRFSQPFYFGRAAHDMVLILMFDRTYTSEDEIRFSLYKYKLPQAPRPAWDFQYVIHKVETNRPYGFRARLVWKKFVSPEDCAAEYQRWAAGKP